MALDSTTNKSLIVWLSGSEIAVFARLQLARPRLVNPPVSAEIQAPSDVKQIVEHSCYSCHSNKTRLPWFDQIAPAYCGVQFDSDYKNWKLVPWNQQRDPRWFGGLIPGQTSSVELVMVEAGTDHYPRHLYTEFSGNPLQEVISQTETFPGDRTAYLLSQRAAFTP
jgi:Haem-binding domain